MNAEARPVTFIEGGTGGLKIKSEEVYQTIDILAFHPFEDGRNPMVDLKVLTMVGDTDERMRSTVRTGLELPAEVWLKLCPLIEGECRRVLEEEKKQKQEVTQ